MSGSGGGRPRTIQAHIEAVMRQKSKHHVWSPTDVHCELTAAGYDHSLEHVHSAMVRMVERGALERLSHGVYNLPTVTAKTSVTYQQAELVGLVKCSKCHALIEDNTEDRLAHTRFHNTWTR